MVTARRIPRGCSLPPVRIEWADLTEYNRLEETYRENDGILRLGERKMIRTDRRPGCMAGIKGKVLQDASMKAPLSGSCPIPLRDQQLRFPLARSYRAV